MKNLVSGFVLLMCISTGSAQSIGSVNFNVFNTLGDFNKHVNSAPMGLSLVGLYRIEETKLLIGGELGVAMYAGESYEQELIVNGSYQTLEVFEEDCFFTYQASARYLMFDDAMFNPYGELKMGGTSFFSTVMASEETESFQDDTQFHGTAFHTSVGAGLIIRIIDEIGMDISASFMPGSRAKYRNMSATDSSPSPSHLQNGTFESTTNQLNYRIGVYFLLQ